MYWTDTYGRIELNITRVQAEAGAHPGPCDADIDRLSQEPFIRRQLSKLSRETVASALREYGAWSDEELRDHPANLQRLLRVACCDINERI